MDVQQAVEQATAFFLHVTRAGAFFAVVPLFGRTADTLMLRLVLAVALGAVAWHVGGPGVPAPANLLALGVMAMREGLVGLALGFALSTMTSLLVSAGEIVSSEMGFSMARSMNPESGEDAAVVGQLLQALGFLLVLQFDLHHDALRVLHSTYEACPVGQPFDIAPIWHGLAALVAGSVTMAVQYAFPIMAIMLLLSVGLVLLGRAVPSINLMEFGFAFRVIAALVAMAMFLGEGAPFLVAAFRGILAGAAAAFGG
jgi:flagellar biosynthetic protein FliR